MTALSDTVNREEECFFGLGKESLSAWSLADVVLDVDFCALPRRSGARVIYL
jgi:hypothetical protein